MKKEKYIIHDNGMYFEVKTTFGFGDTEEDPDEITEIIGMEPDEKRKKGDPSKILPGKINQFNEWLLITTPDVSIDMEDQIDIIINRLKPVKDNIIRYSQLSPPFLNLTIKSYGGDRPLINYRNDVIKFLAEINAETGVDLYIFNDDGSLPLKEIEFL